MVTEDKRSEAKALAASVMRSFFVAPESSQILSGFAELRNRLQPRYAALCAAFEQNVSALATTIGMPVILGSAASSGSHWQRIHSAERIRALNTMAEPGENEVALEARRASQASQVAAKRMKEFVESAEGRDTIAVDACRFLLEALRSANLGEAAAELLRQGIVLTWSALEVLSRDLFEMILNFNPKRVLAVIQEPTAKARFQSKFTLEELATAGFDLSSSLGSLLSSQQDFSDIRTIKAVMLPALNSDKDLETALADKRLWILCQQRHLIVHRRGLVDGRYLEATGESRQVGDRIVISPADLDSHLEAAVIAGRALLMAASKHAV